MTAQQATPKRGRRGSIATCSTPGTAATPPAWRRSSRTTAAWSASTAARSTAVRRPSPPTSTPIFARHATPAYVGKVREVRALAPKVSLVRAVAGMVPDGRRDLNRRSTPSTRSSPSRRAARGGPRCSRARRPRFTAGRICRRRSPRSCARCCRSPVAGGGHGGRRAAMSGCRQHRAMDCGQPRQGNASSRCRSSAIPTRASCRARPGSSCRRACAPPWARRATAPISTCRSAPSSSTTRCVHAVRDPRAASGGHPRGRHGHARVPHPVALRREGVSRSIATRSSITRKPCSGAPAPRRRAIATSCAPTWRGHGPRHSAAAGFERSKPAAFLVEGLLMYLEEADALARARGHRPASRRRAAGSRPTWSIPR